MVQKFPYGNKNVNPYDVEKIVTRWEQVLETEGMATFVSAAYLWGSCENQHFTPFDYYEFTFIAKLLDVSFLLCSHMEKITKITYTKKTVAKIFQALLTERCKHWIPFQYLQAENRLFLPSDILSLPQLQHRYDTFQSVFSSQRPLAVYVSSNEFFEQFLNFSLAATSDCDSTNAEDSL